MAMSGSSIPMPTGGRKSSSQTQAAIDARLNVAASRSAASAAYSGLDTSTFARPVGIINEGNTCFFGSVIQSLAATGSLIELLGPVIFPQDKADEVEEVSKQVIQAEDQDADKLLNRTNGKGVDGPDVANGELQRIKAPHDPFLQPNQANLSVPPPSLTRSPSHIIIKNPTPSLPSSDLIPSLRDEALEISNARLLPVTLAFERALGRAWKAKDGAIKAALQASSPTVDEAGSRTMIANGGSGKEEGKEERKHMEKVNEKARANADKAEKKEEAKSLSFKALLKEVARKYDQYADYRQQDAHELLRHLLDSMSMEEQDLIKILQPPPPQEPSSPTQAGERKRKKRKPVHTIPEGAKMVPFADALFGGSLVSMVICEGCKNVSHTYEGFLDMSLSVKSTPVPRKRDKFKALTGRFRRSSGKEGESDPAQPKSFYLDGVHSDAETHDDATGADTETESLRPDHRNSGTATSPVARSPSQESSSATKPSTTVLQKRSSFSSWTGRKTSKSMTDMAAVRKEATQGRRGDVTPPVTIFRNAMSNGATTPNGRSTLNGHKGLDDPKIPPKPSPEQAAYIRRILNGPNLPDRTDDPLERLRIGIANMAAGVPAGSAGISHTDQGLLGNAVTIEGFGTDLMECLRNFTSVEVLEGDNAFACHKCWKHKAGRFKRKERTSTDLAEPVVEDDEDADDDEGEVAAASAVAESTMSRGDSFALTDASSVALSSQDGSDHLGDLPTIAVTGTDDAEGEPRHVAASIVRMQSTSSLAAPSRMVSHRPGSQGSDGASSGYLTTDGETSDEAPNPTAFVRPSMAPRRQSTRFVLQRAFKRYWIARPPPVMVFHFKRFQQTTKDASIYSTSFSSLKKLDDYVSFPEILDISPFLAPTRADYRTSTAANGATVPAPYLSQPPGDRGPALTPVRYKLYAVVVHLGSSTLAGHYIAYVLTEPTAILGTAIVGAEAVSLKENINAGLLAEKTHSVASQGEKPDSRVWHFCSDHQVRLASAEEVMQSKAYMCFYERW